MAESPALSNFLNGKSSLSPKMAVRLEKAFGANRKSNYLISSLLTTGRCGSLTTLKHGLFQCRPLRGLVFSIHKIRYVLKKLA